MKKIKISKNYLALVPFAAVILTYEIIPLTDLVIDGFRSSEGGSFTLSNYTGIFSSLLYRTAIWNSVRISLVSAAVGIGISCIGAKCYYDCSEKTQDIFMMILNMTSNFSGVPLAFAFMLLMGNTGVITLAGKRCGIDFLGDFNLYSGNGLMLIYIFFQIPLATLLMIPAFLKLKKEWKEAALIMKAGRMQYWVRIGIPNMLPGIMGTFSVLFANAMAAYATAYALVLNNYALLALQISSKFKGDVHIDKQTGGALATVMIMLMAAATLLNDYFTKKNSGGIEGI